MSSRSDESGRRRKRNIRTAPVLLLAGLLGMPLAGQVKACVAYRKNGELRANCDGIDVVLLKKQDLVSYAIGVDGGTVLGGEGWAYMMRGGREANLAVPPMTWTGSIYRSCGTALAPQGEAGRATVDVIAGAPVSFTDLGRPECSADRSLIVGINAAGELVTNRGRVLAATRRFGYFFAVSPSGRWIAFFRHDPGHLTQLCISDTHDWSSRCISKTAKGYENAFMDSGIESGGLSLNDAGGALLVAEGGGGCWYTANAVRGSRTKFPGSSPDACSGVAVASPSSAPRVIIPLGFRPTWVDKKLLQTQFGVFKH